MKITITAELILKMIPFTSLERDNLKTIHLQDPYMVATDGVRMVVYDTTGVVEGAPSDPITINIAGCRKLLISMLKDKTVKKGKVEYDTDACIFTFPGGQSIFCGVPEGTFPDWKSAIPAVNKIGIQKDSIYFNPDLLTDFRAFNPDSRLGCSVHLCGDNIGLVVINACCFGLVGLMDERFAPEKEPAINLINTIRGSSEQT